MQWFNLVTITTITDIVPALLLCPHSTHSAAAWSLVSRSGNNHIAVQEEEKEDLTQRMTDNSNLSSTALFWK